MRILTHQWLQFLPTGLYSSGGFAGLNKGDGVTVGQFLEWFHSSMLDEAPPEARCQA